MTRHCNRAVKIHALVSPLSDYVVASGEATKRVDSLVVGTMIVDSHVAACSSRYLSLPHH